MYAMYGKKTNHYTVCYLFSPDMERVLLVRKNKTDFAGQLNGCGGTVDPHEDGYGAAIREITEETGLIEADLVPVSQSVAPNGPDGWKLAWLGDLVLPYDCKAHDGVCALHLYAGMVKSSSLGGANTRTDANEEIVWEPVNGILSSTAANRRYAGAGDLQYFIGQGIAALRQRGL